MMGDVPIGVIALHRVGKVIAAGKNNAKPQQRFFLSCQTGDADVALRTATRRLSLGRVDAIEQALLLMPCADAALTVGDLDKIIDSTVATKQKGERSQTATRNLKGSAMNNHNLFGKLKGEIMKEGFVVRKEQLNTKVLKLILKYGAQALRLKPKRS